MSTQSDNGVDWTDGSYTAPDYNPGMSMIDASTLDPSLPPGTWVQQQTQTMNTVGQPGSNYQTSPQTEILDAYAGVGGAINKLLTGNPNGTGSISEAFSKLSQTFQGAGILILGLVAFLIYRDVKGAVK